VISHSDSSRIYGGHNDVTSCTASAL